MHVPGFDADALHHSLRDPGILLRLRLVHLSNDAEGAVQWAGTRHHSSVRVLSGGGTHEAAGQGGDRQRGEDGDPHCLGACREDVAGGKVFGSGTATLLCGRWSRSGGVAVAPTVAKPDRVIIMVAIKLPTHDITH